MRRSYVYLLRIGSVYMDSVYENGQSSKQVKATRLVGACVRLYVLFRSLTIGQTNAHV